MHGRCYLAGCRDAASVLGAVASAMGIPLGAHRPLQELGVALRERGAGVLLLDNAEHVVDVVADVVSALRGAAPQATILVTSREVLRLPGEQVVELAGLGPADARALFLQAARRPDLLRGEELDEVLALLDGVPLALQLAAGRSHVLPLAQLARHLREGGLDITTRTRGVPARHRSMRAALQWSWSLLSAEERAALRQLAVFRRLSAEGALEVLLLALPGADPLQLLEQLRDSSMLGEGAQLTFLVRGFVLESIEPDALRRLHLRHARWCLARCEAQDHHHRGRRLAEIRRSPGLDDLQAAISRVAGVEAQLALQLLGYAVEVSVWCASTERSEALLSLLPPEALSAPLERAERLRLGLVAHGLHGRARPEQVQQALALAPEPSETRARLLLLAGSMMDTSLEQMEQHAREAIRLAEAVAPRLLPHAWFSMMQLKKTRGEDQEVLSWMARITGAADAPQDLLLDTWVLAAGSMFRLGEDAEPILRRAHRLAQADGIRRERLKIQMQLGVMLLNKGEHAQAREHLAAALEGYRELGSLLNMAGCWANLGYIALLEEAWESAERALGVAGALCLEADASTYKSVNDAHVAILAACRRQWERADRLLADAIAELAPSLGAGFRAMRAIILARTGQRAAAREELALARTHIAPALRGGVERCAAAAWREPLPALPVPGLFGQLVDLLIRSTLGPTLRIHTDDGWVELDGGERIMLRSRSGPWALLRALARRPDALLDQHDLFAAGWPSQSIQPAAATHRVHVALSTLRKLGLGEVVERRDGGYRLAEGVHVEWL